MEPVAESQNSQESPAYLATEVGGATVGCSDENSQKSKKRLHSVLYERQALEEKPRVVHPVEDHSLKGDVLAPLGDPEESDADEASLNSLWTTLMSGKARSRHARPCIMDVWLDDDKRPATLNIAGDSIKFADKNVLWMFTASSCECCGVRERELLCTTDSAGAPDDDAKEDFFSKYSSLKAVEAGSDPRRIGRIEVMFKDGDALSVGLECESSDVQRFVKLCTLLTKECQLAKHASSGCKTRRRTAVNDTCPDCVDEVAAKDAADRHMMELLADIEKVESVAKTRASVRKRNKKKNCTLLAESEAEPDTGCVYAPAVPSAPYESQEEAVVKESDPRCADDASVNPFEVSTEAHDVADDAADDAEADRHMNELLAHIEVESVAKARASARKRQTKKNVYVYGRING